MNVFQIRNVVYAKLIKYNQIDIKQGIATFIQGESGSGKSSLLRLLNCSHSYDSGSIMYKDQLISQYDPLELRREVSLIAQEVFLTEGSIRDNFKFFYEARNLPLPSEEVMQEYLRITCLTAPLDKGTQYLSGGEKQRVYLAIFLSFKPAVVMLDEPTAALDEATSYQMLGNIKVHILTYGGTAIVISHSKALAAAYADEVIHIVREDGHA